MSRGLAVVAAATLVTLAVTGCVPGADPSDGADNTPPSGNETMAPEESADGDDTASAAEGETRDFANETLEECVVGSWQLDGEVWLAAFEELATADFEGAAVTVTGEIVMDIAADQQYTITAAEFTTTTSASIMESELIYGITFDGAETGQWSVADNALAFTGDEGGSLAISATAELDGIDVAEEIPLPDGTPWSEELTVECGAESLVAVTATAVDDPELVFQRTE